MFNFFKKNKRKACMHDYVFQETIEDVWDGKGCGILIDYYDIYVCSKCGKEVQKRQY